MASSVSLTYSLIENSTPSFALQRRYTNQNFPNLRPHFSPPLRLGSEMAENIIAPIPVTPGGRRTGSLFPPPHMSRAGSPGDRSHQSSPALSGFERRNNPFASLADSLVDLIGAHVNVTDPLYEPLQQALRLGESDSQAILTLCLLLMKENVQTHEMLRALNTKMESISAVQAVHSANLTTFVQANVANPPAIPSATRPANSRQSKAPAGPSARQLYSAAAKSQPPPGPPLPPPTKKAKRTRPPPIDYA